MEKKTMQIYDQLQKLPLKDLDFLLDEINYLIKQKQDEKHTKSGLEDVFGGSLKIIDNLNIYS